MKITSLGGVLCVCLFLMASGGCVTTGVVKNEQRDSVRFASATGAQIFYEAYITKNYTHPMGSGPSFAVGAPLPYRHHVYSTDNVYFNAAVRSADTNHDGVISDEEARVYADSIRPLPSGSVAVAK